MSYAVLWILGLLLIFIEFFLPGMIFGISGGILLLASGFVFAQQTDSSLAVAAYFLILIVSIGIVIYGALMAIKRTRKEQSFLSDDSQAGYTASSFDTTAIGKTGLVVSDLKPGGYILVDDKKMAALSVSGYVVAGSTVEVVSGQEDALIVKAIETKGTT